MTIEYTRLTARTEDVGATEQMVSMRDGVRLATDVYLPDDTADPGPTVLTRLPYDKRGEYTFMPEIAAYFVARGYRVVVQDVRGKFRSEGETLLAVNEAHDGYDTIDWVTKQPWSDGIVGMWGDSYFGFTQLAAASTGHPALRAIAPRLTGTRLAALPIAQPGQRTIDVEMEVYRLYLVTWFQSNDAFDWQMRWERPYAAVIEEWFETVGERAPTYDLWMPHPVQLRRFPDGHPFDAPPVPILQTIGWFDNCAPWQWTDVAAINDRPDWARVQHLHIEAIDHENHDVADVPHPPEDSAAYRELRSRLLPRYLDPAIAFFDVYLRGVAPAETIPRVRWTPVGGEPRTADRWPPPNASPRVWHLRSDGRLDAEPEPAVTQLGWRHHPDDPVPSPVRNPFAFLLEYPDERDLAARDDVLVFETEPLSSAILLAGPVTLRATVSSSGPEMDLFARLTEISSEGSAHLVARGQVTVLEARQPIAVDVDMGQCGYLVAAGRRLRLTLSSSDFPEYVVAPGTGEHRWLAVETAINDQLLAVGGVHGPELELTVLTTTD